MASIVVLIEPLDRDMLRSYLLVPLTQLWLAAGHRVKVHAGFDNPPPADIAFLHVDLTVVPQPYLEAMRRYPVAVNGTLGDLRKRAYSRLLVRRGDDYAGPVFVKSDLNSGGRPEVGKRNRARWLRGEAGPQEPPMSDVYRVYPSIAEVPGDLWGREDLVVEKFLPERDGEAYCLRQCYFLGDAEAGYLLRSRQPVVKGESGFSMERAPVPPGIRELRRQMRCDYGKFDYVLRDGRVVLFDANRTPAHFALRKYGHDEAIARLAGGLSSLLAAASRRA